MYSGCLNLKKIDISYFGPNEYFTTYGWCSNCHSLKAVIIRKIGFWDLSYNSFENCYHMLGAVDETYNPEGLKDGYVYVPKNRMQSLQNVEYWNQLQFRALEDYTKDGTTTGEFDDEKAGLV
jgi:hypothetical protein